MHEVICPNCGKAFKIDEAGYADIVKQVHDSEFEKALQERLALAEKAKKTEIALAETRLASELGTEAAKKEAEIAKLKAELSSKELATRLAVNEAVSVVEKERDALAQPARSAS